MPRRLAVGILLLITVLAVIDVRTGGPAVLGAYFEQIAAQMNSGAPNSEAGLGAYSYTVSGDIAGSAQGVSTFSVENPRGSITVTGSSSGEVKVGYAVTVYADSEETAEKYAKSLQVKLQRNDTVLGLVVERPSSPSAGLRGMQVDYTITVPKTAGLRLGNALGPVRVTGIDNDVSVQNRFGPTTVVRVDGNLVLDCSQGYVAATEVNGNVKLNNRYQGSEISNVRGAVTVDAGFGSLEIRQVEGTVVATCRYGNASVQGVSGPAELHSSFGGLAISDVEGPVTADSRYGVIRASGIANSASLLARNGSIAAELVRGIGGYSVDATAHNGRITTNLPLEVARSEAERKESLAGSLDGGKFDIKLRSEYGDIAITME